jgi:hypothetical protein
VIALTLLMVRLAAPYGYADLPSEESAVYLGYGLCYADEQLESNSKELTR